MKKKSKSEIQGDSVTTDKIVDVQQGEIGNSKGCNEIKSAPGTPKYVVDGVVWEQTSMFS